MKIVVIDGQGGRMGSLLTAQIKKTILSLESSSLKAGTAPIELLAIGTNSIATAAMLHAGAEHGATGENPVLAACRDADYILGPIGILAADALYGEVTPAMAAAIGRSRAEKILLPVNRCSIQVAGVPDLPLSALVEQAVGIIRQGIAP